MLPDDPRHGTTAGYHAHIGSGAEPCEPCRRAIAGYEAKRAHDRASGRPRLIPALGTARRIQALVAIGHTFGDIAREMGVAHDVVRHLALHRTHVRPTTAHRVDATFQRLCMTPAPDGKSARYARTVARRYGWAPPLAWDDIDDPDATPIGHILCASLGCNGEPWALGMCRHHYYADLVERRRQEAS